MDRVDPHNQQVAVGLIPTSISKNLSGGRRIMAQAHAGAGMRIMVMRKITVSIAI